MNQSPMSTHLANIIEHLCYTELVYDRINKKLGSKLSKPEIEEFIMTSIKEVSEKEMEKIGKNFYLVNKVRKVSFTINSNTFRVITVDKI